ncbi:hypothetical protein HN832_01895 [archaeon]|jgi:predicted AlkP superfamily phosphohydrolase/phosphomutase|nr:hypothetical protein [archaeon]MBT4373105.1 hypothetical protein [archaeon]MBT4531450.1 hypothetical protein [archaeon]MBT7001372.1 hypothetical protein [archaeon]MBT7282142.1 hypothetical protein [archaeon]
MSKVFIFGIDGAFPEYVLDRWLKDLPNIRGLLLRSQYGKMNSTIPPLSATAWSSIYTGKNPADTGIFEYVYRKNYSYEDIRLINSTKLKEKTIWQIASDNGKKSIVCFPLLTWPIKPFDGILISGTLTPPGEKVECVYPSELKQEIMEKLGEVPMPDIPNFRNLSKEEVIQEARKMTEKHIEIMKYLMENKKWDLFFGVINMSDRLHHMFWRYLDEKHRKYDPKSEFKNVIKDFYIFLDTKLGEILKLIEKDTSIFLLSDHGITRMHNRVNLTDWLINEGYLVLKNPITEKTKFKLEMVDWEKTKVFAIGAYEGQIYLNLRGREPNGIVESSEYSSLLNELEIKLKGILGDDGKELNTKIFIKKRDYDGKLIEEAPDMIVYFDDLEYGCNSTLIGNKTLWSPSTAKGSDDATHSKQGIFVKTNSLAVGENIGEVNYLDIAPTILNALGINPPAEMQGKIIK